MEATLVAEGEAAIAAFLPMAEALTALIASNFPTGSPKALKVEFEKQASTFSSDSPALNKEVVARLALLAEEVATATENFRRAEMWISMHQPSISDGNNFGADVQNHVLEELKKMRLAIKEMLDGVSTYHWQRGLGLEKTVNKTSKDVSSTSTKKTGKDNDKKDGKDEKKETSSESSDEVTKTSTTVKEPLADLLVYVVELDVKQFYNTRSCLVDIRNAYVKASSLFEKNMKRLADPRGDGGDGDRGSNMMSMF